MAFSAAMVGEEEVVEDMDMIGLRESALSMLDDFNEHGDDDDDDDDDEGGAARKGKKQTLTRHAPPQAEWFHGQLSRQDAERLLVPEAAGTYLVRESVRNAGDFSISFKAEGGVKHFKVISHEYGDFYIGDNQFSSLSAVVQFYCNELLSNNRSLERPLKPVGTSAAAAASAARQVIVMTHDYEPNGPNELACTKGERLAVLNDKDAHWIWASRPGSTYAGFVPRSFVKIIGRDISEREASAAFHLPSSHHRSQWLHGKIDRHEAERLLLTEGKFRSFLIRESSAPIGDFSLSFRLADDRIQHFKIHVADQASRYEVGGRSFDCLEAIVLRYLNDPLLDDTCLADPVAPSKLDDEDDEDAGTELYSDVQYSKKPAGGTVPPKPQPMYETLDRAAQSKKKQESRNVKMGKLVKKSKKSKKWKSTLFALHGHKKRLYYFDSDQAVKPKGIVDLASSGVYTVDDSLFGRPHCFQIIVPGGQIYLCADTSTEKMEWLSALAEHCSISGVGQDVSSKTSSASIISFSISLMEAKQFGKAGRPYAVVSLNGVRHARTPLVAPKSQSVFWGETYEFDNLSESITTVTIELLNRGKRKDGHIAALTLPMSQFPLGKALDCWQDLTSDGASCGSVRIKGLLKQEVVLAYADYKKFKGLFTDKDLGAAQALVSVSRSNLNEIARHLVTIWRADGIEVDLLSELTALVVKSESSQATLFRGNSLSTKALDQYMKMTAIPYLKSSVGNAITAITEEKRSCEMDPSRGAKPDNIKVLLQHCSAICTGIFDSAAQCPERLRSVFARLKKQVMAKWPDDKQVTKTAITAFLFLRLFCPAIMNPKLFNMMPDHPTENIARNLTLIAKVIINLANLSEFGQKEPYMIPCNEFLEKHHPQMVRFLETVSQAPNKLTQGPVPAPESTARDLAALYIFCTDHLHELTTACSSSKQKTAQKLPAVLDKLHAKVAKAEKAR